MAQRSLSLCHRSIQGEASGKLYIDDGISFDYEKGKYELREIMFKQGRLISRYVDFIFTCNFLSHS